ncbi:MAG: Stk1 family PASTA domain-containing Ser/Thr kinase [Clostridia bacterium]
MIGTILGNRYEIIEKIGAGGMALVYKAHCRLLNRFVAVKILRREFIEDQEFISRFSIESQAAASLSHPNVVSVYDVGQQDDIYYIVMEYIDGITLKEMINKNGALPWKEALNYSVQICSALEHAHKKHIVHRDIKPHNIMITKEGMVKVTDFGIARAVTSATVTLGGNTIGSVHYFSPEQARGSYTDEKSDIYSLGIVMYEMLTSRVPFDGDSPVAVAIKHIQELAVPPKQLNKNIPIALQSIVLKAIHKDQGSRYSSAVAMLKDLYQAFEQPNEDFIDSEGFDDYPTRKIPIININGSENMGKRKKKVKKEDRIAIIAAIITSLFIISGLTFVGYNMLKDRIAFSKNIEQKVPDLVGKDYNTVKGFYTDEHKFTVLESEQQYNDEYEKGRIISQDPAAEIVVKIPQTIKVIVSKGAKVIKVPELVNKEYRQAEIDLEDVDLNYKVIDEYHDTIPEGIIIRNVPEEGTEVQIGDIIQLYVSRGRKIKMVTVPTLVGKSEDEAKRMISESGLLVGEIIPEISDQPKGLVIGQGLTAQSEVEEKTLMNLTVSKGKVTDEVQRYINIPLPNDKDKVTIKIEYYKKTDSQSDYIFEKVAYEKMHSTSEGEGVVTIPLSGRGTIYIAVYIDGQKLGDENTRIDFGGDVQ